MARRVSDFAPQQAQPFLGEPGDDRDDGRRREDANVEDRLAHEFGLVAVRDRSHEVAADVAVENVQAASAA